MYGSFQEPDLTQGIYRNCTVAWINTICTPYSDLVIDGMLSISSELLPSAPEGVETEALTEHSVRVSWLPPSGNAETVTTYVINVTSLRQFDQDPEPPEDSGFFPAPSTTADSYVRAAQEVRTTESTPMASSTQAPFSASMKVSTGWHSPSLLWMKIIRLMHVTCCSYVGF